VVAFSGAAQVLVPPTTDTGRVRRAIQGLTTGRATGIGNAILAGIDAISEVNPDVAPSTIDLGHDPSANAPTTSEFTPDIIVLLTDGANNIGVDPMVAAAQAADRKVRVYTIGFGTDDPGPPVCTSDQLGSDPLAGQFGGPGGLGAAPSGALGSGSRFLASDQQALQKIADATGGTAYRAATADQLLRVFHKLPTRVVVQTETRELTAAFVAAGVALTVLALALSMRWNRFV
jgi:Ca-activated chloride channel homolog